MNAPPIDDEDDDSRTGPSRQEIETLCVLHALGPAACTEEELAMRLGLCAALGPALGRGIQPMVEEGLVAAEAGTLRLTALGGRELRRRLGDYLPRGALDQLYDEAATVDE